MLWFKLCPSGMCGGEGRSGEGPLLKGPSSDHSETETRPWMKGTQSVAGKGEKETSLWAASKKLNPLFFHNLRPLSYFPIQFFFSHLTIVFECFVCQARGSLLESDREQHRWGPWLQSSHWWRGSRARQQIFKGHDLGTPWSLWRK